MENNTFEHDNLSDAPLTIPSKTYKRNAIIYIIIFTTFVVLVLTIYILSLSNSSSPTTQSTTNGNMLNSPTPSPAITPTPTPISSKSINDAINKLDTLNNSINSADFGSDQLSGI